MNKTLIASAALALTAAFSTAVVAQTSTTPGATTTTPHAWHHHHHSPFMGALKQLDLNDTQKASIHQIFETQHTAAKTQFASFRTQRQAFAALDPSAADYQQQVNGFADEAAAAARQRTQEMAQLKTQVIAVLTPAQKTQFLAYLANPPKHEHFAPAG